MSLLIHREAQTSLVRLEGTFTFESHGQFRAITQELVDAPTTRQITLDLSGLTYLDSSSLGMLLLLRDKTEAKGIKVVLVRPSPTVMRILNVVQFGKLFEIQED